MGAWITRFVARFGVREIVGKYKLKGARMANGGTVMAVKPMGNQPFNQPPHPNYQLPDYYFFCFYSSSS